VADGARPATTLDLTRGEPLDTDNGERVDSEGHTHNGGGQVRRSGRERLQPCAELAVADEGDEHEHDREPA